MFYQAYKQLYLQYTLLLLIRNLVTENEILSAVFTIHFATINTIRKVVM